MSEERERDALEEFELAMEELEEEAEEQVPDIPDKPTGIAPGDVDYPGKGAPPAGAKGGAAIREAQRAGRTGPKGADFKSANQS